MIGSPEADGHRKTRVFISYSRHDSVFVDALYSALLGRGYDAFLDRQDIGAAERWRPRLENLILSADVILFVMTDASLRSPICSWEVSRVEELGKRLLPLAHGPRTLTPAPGLSALNWVFSDDPQRGATIPDAPTGSALDKLNAAIDVDVHWLRAHSALITRSEEWHRSERARDRLLPESLIDGAERILATAPISAGAMSPSLLEFVAQSRQHARSNEARRVAREASEDLQRQRADYAVAEIRQFVSSCDYDAFESAPELCTEASTALTLIGLPFAPFKVAADDKRKMGLLESVGLILAASGSELVLRSVSDFSKSESITFDRPIAGFDTDDHTQNILITFMDGSVYVWNARTKRAGVRIISEPIRTQIAKFASAGSTILTLEIIKHGRVWETSTGRQIANVKAGFTSFVGAHFDEQSRRILAMCGFADLRQWQVGLPEELPRADEEPSSLIPQVSTNGEASRAEFDPTGRFVFVEGVPSSPGQLVPRVLFALERGPQRHSFKRVWYLPSDTHAGRAIAFSSDGEHLAVQLADRRVSVFRTRDGGCCTIVPSGVEYNEITLSKGGETLLGLTPSGSLDIWRRRAGDSDSQTLKPFALGEAGLDAKRRSILRQAVWLQSGGVTSVAFSSDGVSIAATFRNGQFGLFSNNGHGYLCAPKIDAVATGFCLSQAGDSVLVTFSSGYVGVASLAEKKWRVHARFGDKTQWQGAWLADSRSIIVVSGDGLARIIDASTGLTTASVASSAGSLLAVARLSTGEIIIGASSGFVIAVRQVTEGIVELMRWKVSEVAVTALKPFPQGDKFAAACADGTLLFWDIRTNAADGQFRLSNHSLTSLDFSSDCARFCVTTKGGEVGVYSMTNARVLLFSKVHDRPVWSAKFCPTGDSLVLGLEDGSIRIIDVMHTKSLGADFRSAFLALSGAGPTGDQRTTASPMPSYFGGWHAERRASFGHSRPVLSGDEFDSDRAHEENLPIDGPDGLDRLEDTMMRYHLPPEAASETPNVQSSVGSHKMAPAETTVRRILSLDGGGVRGIIAVAFLERLESELRLSPGKENLVLADHFDLIGGTSVGSILATMLALGWPMERVGTVFRSLCPKIFSSPLGFGILRPKFRAHSLERLLKRELGDMQLDDPQFKTLLAIVTKRLDTGSPWWIVTNNPSSRWWKGEKEDEKNHAFRVRDLIRASTAAPTVFEPHELRVEGARKTGLFVDGGLTPFNSPAIALLQIARMSAHGLNWPLGEDNLQFVSIGTGMWRDPVKMTFWNRYVAANFGVNALKTMITGSQTLSLALLQWMSRPARPWKINEEMGDLANDILGIGDKTPQPLFSFAHYDLDLSEEGLKAALGKPPSDRKLRRLRALDNPSELETLYALAMKAANEQVDVAHLK